MPETYSPRGLGVSKKEVLYIFVCFVGFSKFLDIKIN
jgi:hypothetical protein